MSAPNLTSSLSLTTSVSFSNRLDVGRAFSHLSQDMSERPRHGVPFTIPKGELYYWTARWQADEQESLDSIAHGNIRVFDSDDPTDAVRWLLSDDEE